MNFTLDMLLNLRRLTLADTAIRADLLAGKYRRLTPEVVIWEETWRRLPPWEQALARTYAFGVSADRAVLSGKSAARVLGIATVGSDPLVEMTYPNPKSFRARRSWPPHTVFRSSALSEDEVCVVDGIRVTTTFRTLRDVARYHGVVAGVVAIDDLRRKSPGLSIEDLHRSMTVEQRYHGVGAVRQAIDLSGDSADSPLESMARVILVRAGVGRIQTQGQIRPSRGTTTYRVDLLIDGWLIVELDGNVKYDGATFGKRADEVIRAERQREKELQNAGFLVLRATFADLSPREDGGCGLLDMVAAAQRRRTTRPSA
ncbi:hypothetical protein [Corynebacterium guangdongense]|uniref:Very-short-patch-repair endonuclease n=1 Tax=Corynebacterium guangdongense TaxID=1783348 RepID=A0ABU1ZXS4_9CORY|nr:hypothetical protein [Corynebacterium guangdongense]MDR7329022.1 very-short-patch-repair endonuclease [Corynebacterium guangdongense]WJZ17592.1 hypothetical protein CGUA_05035 [Corynebacterium guangdongense]